MTGAELTVIVPTHDVEHWIDECLTSIRNQQGVGLRIVVVDDHSTDGTLAIVERHAREDERLEVLHAGTTGGGPARNLGLTRVETPYLAFADGDDLVPDGAYAALVGALRESGSDMAIGNFLKFAATRTWQPMLTWQPFARRRVGIQLDNLPVLVRNRACWNRVFRAEFWREQGIAFPDVPRANDIVPMTEALTAAQAIDVVPEVVYLYRERPGAGSMTARSGSSVSFLSYLAQESACRELLAERRPAVLPDYLALFLEADGWAHLSKYLASTEDPDGSVDAEVSSAIDRFLELASPEQLARLDPLRRAGFELVAQGRVDLARELLARIEHPYDIGRLAEDARFWLELTGSVAETPRADAATIARIRARFVLRPLLDVAWHAHPAETAAAVAAIRGLGAQALDDMGADAVGWQGASPLDLRRAASAIQTGDAERFAEVSRLRADSALRVEVVEPARGGVRLRGTTRLADEAVTLQVVARRAGGTERRQVGRAALAARHDGERAFTADLEIEKLPAGEWKLRAVVGADEHGPVQLGVIAERRGGLVPERRLARSVVLPRRQVGDQLLLVSRGPLLARLVRRVRKR